MSEIDSAATYGYLKTTGRVSGKSHEVEIWFAVEDNTIFVLSGSGGKSDWCYNLDHAADAVFRISAVDHRVRGRRIVDTAEAKSAKAVVYAKYSPTYRGDLSEWRERSAAFAFDLQ